MIDELRRKLKTVMQQLNGFNNIKPETEKAIKKYLSD